jgi:two-component system OmpR family response regulator
LVVVDDATLAEALAAILRQRRIRATQAAMGLDALAQLRRRRFDVLVVDLHMPDMSTGLDLLRQLRAEGKEIPVVLLSAVDGKITGRDVLALDIRAIFDKPVLLASLAHAIDDVARSTVRRPSRRYRNDLNELACPPEVLRPMVRRLVQDGQA